MAQTKIWDTNNPYKTLWYMTQDKKVKPSPESDIRYVTGINCFGDPEHFARDVAERFKKTKERFQVLDGVQAYHAEQSFLPGEVTPEEAHQIGVQLAKELWPGFEVVVATHLDTEVIHNHFCFNSVSQKDGHKFHDCLKSYAHMRKVSDRICKERGLSTIEEPGRGRHKNYRTWQREQDGEERVTVRSWIREDIDKALPTVASLPELYEKLGQMRYTVNTTGKYVKVRPDGKDRYFRLYKLGKGYSEEELYDRIQKNLSGEYRAPRKLYYTAFTFFRVRTLAYAGRRQRYRPGSLRATYLCYRHLLRRYVHGKYPSPEPSLTLREDARDLQKVTDKTYLLCVNRIESRAQLKAYWDGLAEKVKMLAGNRQELRSKLAKSVDPAEQEALRKEIASLSAEIRNISREEKLCEEIDQEAQQVEAKTYSEVAQLKEEQEKSLQESERNDMNEH